jgi:hypothetical protein
MDLPPVLLPLLSISISFAVQFAIYIGLGSLLSPIINEKKHGVFELLLLGLFLLTLIVTAAHFFIPIGLPLLIIIAPLSLAGLWLWWHNERSIRISKSQLIAGVMLIFLISYIPETRYIHYDTGLYHFQKVQWYNAEPVWPGLALLHSRFGFNVSFFMPVAFFRAIIPFADLLHYSISSFWVAAFTLHLSGLSKEQAPPLRIFLLVLAATVVLSSFLWPGLWGFSPDPVVTVITLFLYTRILLSIEEQQIKHPAAFLIWITLLVSVKLSGVILLFPILVLCFLPEVLRRLIAPGIMPSLAISTIFLLLYGLHGFLESGYLSYPTPTGFVPTEWSLPESVRLGEVLSIRGWARSTTLPYAVSVNGTSWIKPWLLNLHNILVWVPLLLSFAITVAMLFKRCILKEAALFVLLWASILAWFYTAPDPRFGLSVLLFTICFPVLLIFKTWPTLLSSIPLIPLSKLIPALTFIAAGSLTGYRLMSRPYKTVPLPNVPVAERKAENFTGRQPVTGDQCWTAQIPCAPQFPTNLRQRQYRLDPLTLQGYSMD